METKTCANCKEAKPRTEYTNRAASKDGLHPRCKKCKNDQRNAFRAAEKAAGRPLDVLEWKRANKDKARDQKTRRRRALRDYLRELRKDVPCTDCGGIFPPTCMDWDHLDPSQKEFNIAKAIQELYTKEKIHAEIDKCELVCSNCHRIRSAIQRGDDPWA